MVKSKVLLLAILVSCFLIVNQVSASTEDIIINYPTITPNSELYPIKRLWEKGFHFVLFSQKMKFNYNEGLLKERLAELKYVAEKKLLSEIETSSNRFAHQAGVTIEQLRNLNDKGRVDKTLDQFKSYSKTLASLRDLYEANSSFWRLIQQDIDTLNILSDKIKN